MSKKVICIELIKNNDLNFILYLYQTNFEWLYKFCCYVSKHTLQNINLEFNDISSFIFISISKLPKLNPETINKYWLKPLLKFLVKQELFMMFRYLKNNKNQILNKAITYDDSESILYKSNNIDYEFNQKMNAKLDLEMLLKENKDVLKNLSNLEKQIVVKKFYENKNTTEIAKELNLDVHKIKLKIIKIRRVFKKLNFNNFI